MHTKHQNHPPLLHLFTQSGANVIHTTLHTNHAHKASESPNPTTPVYTEWGQCHPHHTTQKPYTQNIRITHPYYTCLRTVEPMLSTLTKYTAHVHKTPEQPSPTVIIIIIIIIINLIYIAQFDTNGILTALYIVITYIQMQYVHVWTYMKQSYKYTYTCLHINKYTVTCTNIYKYMYLFKKGWSDIIHAAISVDSL